MARTTFLSDGWQFAQREWTRPGNMVGYAYTEWLPADVPGAVHLDLQRAGIIPDPHQRMNEIGVQWVDEKDWSYRTAFQWHADPELPRRVLRFDSLDTVATIYLNDEEIGGANNMFLPHEFDVTERLVEGENTLRIEFQSAQVAGNARRKEYFEANGITDPVSRMDERAFLRKMQCAFGWDWGPRLASCGVSGPVSLIEYVGRIASFSTISTYHDDGSITIELDARHDGPGELVPTIWPTDGGPMEGEDETTEWENGRITLRHLRRWQPTNLLDGEDHPLRYEMSLALVDGDEILDESTKTVGFSQNRLV
ncbi:hypothetical protein EON77_09805, partial [bacterium]